MTSKGDERIEIDGSEGEGGGQILRSALTLSLVTGRPFRLHRIRARRVKPGLLRQHLTAVRAATTVGAAQVSGDELGSTELVFTPGSVSHGDYTFAVGSAGSVTLVLQTVLWPLLLAPGRSRLTFEGGTHNPMAPPFEFIAEVFLPLLRRMGAHGEARLVRHGFYPAGGGSFVVDVEGGHPLAPLELYSRGAVLRRRARALLAHLPKSIGDRELRVVRTELGLEREEVRVVDVDSAGPGNALLVWVEAEHSTELFCAFGERRVSAEQVAARVVAGRFWLDASLTSGVGKWGNGVALPPSTSTTTWATGEPTGTAASTCLLIETGGAAGSAGTYGLKDDPCTSSYGALCAKKF